MDTRTWGSAAGPVLECDSSALPAELQPRRTSRKIADPQRPSSTQNDDGKLGINSPPDIDAVIAECRALEKRARALLREALEAVGEP